LVTIFINTSDIAPSSPYNFRKISISTTTTTITNRLLASPALHLHHHLKKSIAHHQWTSPPQILGKITSPSTPQILCKNQWASADHHQPSTSVTAVHLTIIPTADHHHLNQLNLKQWHCLNQITTHGHSSASPTIIPTALAPPPTITTDA
jgi:hypothetical protein